MNTVMTLLVAATGFLGFAAGRLGDKIGGHWNVPHHWIYGLMMIVAGAVFIEHTLGMLSIAFGKGHFISDLKDFWHMRVWGPDKEHRWKFWGID